MNQHTHLQTTINPFAIYQHNLATAQPQTIDWLWQKRLPLAGITLLDGDHGTGKSLLTLQIAAAVSSGSPMPDGSPTIQGGVVIIAPNSNAATFQFQFLSSLGANLAYIEILTFVQDEPTPESQNPNYHPFSLPDDLPALLEAAERTNARLIILDPFINLLSRNNRWTHDRLSHLLADLNQRLIERNIACLLIRNCPAKGGHTRPSMLERSDYFLTNAVSRLLLAPDPFQLDRLLLSHANSQQTALNSTLILRIQPHPDHPDLPQITQQGPHTLKAQDFIANRPDTLHRRLLFQHLKHLLTEANKPTPVATLYAQSPNSSPFQIQRSLKDLLNMGQIERPARGFYAPAPTNPIFSSDTSMLTGEDLEAYQQQQVQAEIASLKADLAKKLEKEAKPSAERRYTPYRELLAEAIQADPDLAAYYFPHSAPDNEPASDDELASSAATTVDSEADSQLASSAATTTEPVNDLNSTAATTPNPGPTSEQEALAAKLHAQVIERARRETYMDNPYPELTEAL